MQECLSKIKKSYTLVKNGLAAIRLLTYMIKFLGGARGGT